MTVFFSTVSQTGDYIDEIHKEWKGDYDRLEWHHGYIQWLFPIRESGMNWHAQELQSHEIEVYKINLNLVYKISLNLGLT